MVSTEMRKDPGKTGERYSAPAMEKGLDILEALSRQAEGLTQKQVAKQLGHRPARSSACSIASNSAATFVAIRPPRYIF